MDIAYVAGIELIVDLGTQVDLSAGPTSFGWELREAKGLARLGHKVRWVSPYTLIMAFAFDCVFCAADTMSNEAINIGRKYRVPVVLQMISRPADYPDKTWDRIKEAMLESQGITCVSPVVLRGTKQWARENNYGGLIELVPHGCEVELVDSVPEQPRTHFVYVGALMEHKRVDWLIRAAAKTGLPLVIVGEGPERKKLELLAMLYSAPVEFKGFLISKDVFVELKRAKALLHASIGEQFHLPSAEALACNTRVICHYLPDVRDTYGDSLTYFSDFDELCDLMRTFWELPDTFAGRIWVEKLGLSLEARSRKLTKVLEEIVLHGK